MSEKKNQYGAEKAAPYTKLSAAVRQSQTLIWMALPNGRNSDNNKLKLSAAVAPRLQVMSNKGEMKLRDCFPDFIDWPSWVASTLLQDNNFKIEFRPATGVAPSATASVVSEAPNSSLWKSVFPEDTIVRTFAPQERLARFKLKPDTFDDPLVEDTLRKVYSKVALEDAVTPPLVSKLLSENFLGKAVNKVAELQGLNSLERGTNRTMQAQQKTLGNSFRLPSSQPSRTMSLSQQRPAQAWSPLLLKAPIETVFKKYYTKSPKSSGKIFSEEFERYDFHQIVSFLRDYPELLRWLGLVIDLEVDDPGIQGQVDIRLIHNNLGSTGSSRLNSRPWTRCALSSTAFTAKSDVDKTVKDGMLAFEDKELFSPGEMDIESTARKTTMSFSTLAAATEMGADYPLPAMRTRGLGMLISGRVDKQNNKLIRAIDLEKKLFMTDAKIDVRDDFILFAEDIMRGFRADVCVKNDQDGTWKWYSLCRRNMEYQVVGSALPGENPVEEGAVTTALFKKTNIEGEEHEMLSTLFNWDGWSSLCVPRAGGAVPEADQTEKHKTGLFLKATPSSAPGTLPPLRFGRTYRFRARVVDLAGNSLPPDITDEKHASGEIVFRRFEPVAAPVLVMPPVQTDFYPDDPTEGISPGESVETMVIRSRLASSITNSCSRTIATPLVPASFVALHGKFDDQDYLRNGGMGPFLLQQSQRLSKLGLIDSNSKSNVNPLPDPLAMGITFRNLPGSAKADLEVAQTVDSYCCDPGGQKACADTWPEISVLEFRIEEGTGEPKREGNRITIYLPKAEKTDILYSSWIKPESLRWMALSSWIDEEAARQKAAGTESGLIAQMRDLANNAARKGLHWMLTPSRKITLVHAVKEPLAEPVMTPVFDPSAAKEMMRRDLNTTWSPMDFLIGIHGKSTGKVDVAAQWDEIADSPDSELGTAKTAVTQHVFQADVHLDGSDSQSTSGGLVHFTPIPDDDTGVLLCGAFVDRAVVREKPAPAGWNSSALKLAKRLKLETAWKNVEMSELAKIEAPRHEFGDTKHRKITYHAVCATRFREYFHPMRGTEQAAESEAENHFIRTGPDIIVHVPSSARPAPLKIAYIIPSFEWGPLEKNGNTLSRKRKGNGLRVYFEGPWYSSGENEMLGVAHLPHDKIYFKKGQVPGGVQIYISQWGTDPITQSAALPARYPTTKNFAEGAETSHGLSIPGLEDYTAAISITGYAVNYDRDKKLWYADVRMDPAEAYFPFVRLALARYQPYSIKGAHLSPISIADFAQLLPDRKAQVKLVSRIGVPWLDLEVAGASSSRPDTNIQGRMHTAGSTMVSTLEKENNDISDALLKWSPVQEDVIMKASNEGAENFSFKWSGATQLPAKSGEEKYRVVVKEYEEYQDQKQQVAKRLVYAEAFELDQIGY